MPKIRFEAPAQALAKWNSSIKAKKDSNDINIYSTVGDYGDGGITARLVSAILRKADGADVVVNINSPGGDFFEGLAIHTLLSEYEGNVKVKVVGLAASAASVIAMAGDEVEIAESGFLMIHNAWTVAMGNKNDMQEVVDTLSKFDNSMASLYARKTGEDEKTIKKMMDAETWLDGKQSVEKRFASAILGADQTEEDEEEKISSALRKVDVELAKAGMPRTERRNLIKELTSTPSAADVMPSADAELCKALSDLHANLTNIKGLIK
jgi:ATP-dependent Clp protease protease subunit